MQSLIGGMQILDESLVRMRHSMHGRTLLEMTLVQIAQLHRLEDLFSLAGGLRASAALPQATAVTATGAPASASDSAAAEQKKNAEPIVSGPATVSVSADTALSLAAAPIRATAVAADTAVVAVPIATAGAVATSTAPVVTVDTKNAKEVWGAAVDRLQGLLADFAALSVDAAWVDEGQLSVSFEKRSQHAIDHLQRPDRKSVVERELQNVLGRSARVQFQAVPDRAGSPAEMRPANDPNSLMQRNQRLRQVAEHPMVKALVDTLGGELLRVDPPAAPRSHLDRKG
jgi:DNA polymerase-3 subunit gamma/tau